MYNRPIRKEGELVMKQDYISPSFLPRNEIVIFIAVYCMIKIRWKATVEINDFLFSHILSEFAHMKLSRIPANTLTVPFMTDICTTVRELERDQSCRGVIISSVCMFFKSIIS